MSAGPTARRQPSLLPGGRELPSHVPVEDRSATRQKLLETAEALFYEEGFHAVGLDRILHAVGISKQAFYKHFGGKEELALEVIRWHDRWWRDQCRRLLTERAGDDARRQLDAFAEILIELLDGQAFRGCFFVNAAAQFPNPYDPIHRAAMEAKEHIEALIRDMALRAGADDPAAFACEFSMIFEGAFATRSLRRCGDVVPVLRGMVASLAGRRLPVPV
ncbi:MAG TPA: TetR/AcrR family transcriptional regulator [Planctomycetaceae bacterium]